MNAKEISDILRERRMLLDDYVVATRKDERLPWGRYKIERDPYNELYIIGEPVRYDVSIPHGEFLFNIDEIKVYAYPNGIEIVKTYCGLEGTRESLKGHTCPVCVEGDRQRRCAFEIERMQRLGKI